MACVRRRASLRAYLIVVAFFCLSVTELPAGPGPRLGGEVGPRGVLLRAGAPTLTGAPPAELRVGERLDFTPQATDPNGDQLRFSIGNEPGWVQFDTASGRMTGTPPAGSEGVYSGILLSASDGVNTTSIMFDITVTSTGTASFTVSWTPPTQNEDGTSLTDLVGYKLYYGDSPGDYPNVVRINHIGVTSWIVDNLMPRTYYVVATAVDAHGLESRHSNVAIKLAR